MLRIKIRTNNFENVDYRELSARTYTSKGAEHDAQDYESTIDPSI